MVKIERDVSPNSVKIEDHQSIPATILTTDHSLTFDTKNKILLGEYGIQNVNSLNGYGVFSDKLRNFSLKNFSNELNIKLISISKANKKSELRIDDKAILTLESRENLDIEFDIIGAEAALVNAFRRILLAEVPTMAFEKCYLMQNTSIVQDEILCHRLGLIPLKIDPKKFQYRPPVPEASESPVLPDLDSRTTDTIRFSLNVKASWRDGQKPEGTKPGSKLSKMGGSKLSKQVQDKTDKELFVNSHVYSGDLVWEPLNEAQKRLFGDDHPRPVHSDILLARLRPNQEIKLVVDAVKGIGGDHAKFSPVATASYRLHPTIDFKEPVRGKLAKKLQACFPPGVIGISRNPETDREEAYVGENLRNDVVSREVYRHEDLKDKVQLGRLSNHFIFNIESTGALPAKDLFCMATEILQEKCELVGHELSNSNSREAAHLKAVEKGFGGAEGLSGYVFPSGIKGSSDNVKVEVGDGMEMID